MASSPVWSCHAPVIRARRWIMAVTIFFFLVFFLHCLADHLLLQLTCEWSWWPRWLTPGEPESGKSCERWRETERESKRPRPNTPTHTHTHQHTHTVLCLHSGWAQCISERERRHIYAARGRHLLLGPGVPSEMLAWRARLWQVLPPRQRGSATNQTRVVCSSRKKTQDRAGSVIPTWHRAQHQSLEPL